MFYEVRKWLFTVIWGHKMREGIDVGFSTTSTHLNLRVILIVKFMVKNISIKVFYFFLIYCLKGRNALKIVHF